jgi:hypothetical protein
MAIKHCTLFTAIVPEMSPRIGVLSNETPGLLLKDVALYTGDPVTATEWLRYPLLSRHAVTFEPESVSVLESAASSHNTQSAMDGGENPDAP